MINIYQKGIEYLYEKHLYKPAPNRVTLKAILKNAESAITKGTASENTDQAIAYEVWDVGENVTKCAVGQHCLQVSGAATPVDFDLWEKKRSMFCVVHEDDILSACWPEAAAKLFE